LGLDLLDVKYRLERRFGVKVTNEQMTKLAMRNEPPDINVGALFELIRDQIPQSGVLDLEIDAELLWPLFQQEISDALGVNVEDVTKYKGLIHDLGAT
jgi:hypothetical protein